MKSYKPAYLYIKTHTETGLKYFGKTSQDPYLYQGSGTDWGRHIAEHGYNVTTALLNDGMPYDNENELIETAIAFSIKNNIVESIEWANKRIENGDGGDTSMCENYIKAIANRNQTGNNNPMWGIPSFAKGKTYEELYGEQKAKELKSRRIESATGRKLSDKSIEKMSKSISLATKGVPKPQSVATCPKCDAKGALNLMKRWHFDNCKKMKDKNENN